MREFATKQRVMLAVVPRVVAGVIRLLGATLRFEDVCAQGVAVGDTILGPTVFCFWHRSLLLAAYRFRGLRIAILISRSYDGELIARTVERLGFVAVRGSSTRGGSVGLRGMERDVSRGTDLRVYGGWAEGAGTRSEGWRGAAGGVSGGALGGCVRACAGAVLAVEELGRICDSEAVFASAGDVAGTCRSGAGRSAAGARRGGSDGAAGRTC